MRCQMSFAPDRWAKEQFGSAELGDKRRTDRAVQVATRMACNPAASIPRQAGSFHDAKATYRMFDCDDVTFEGLIEPHMASVRQRAGASSTVLMVQDTTHLDFTKHPAAEELGPIGNGRGRGFIMHSTLAIDPEGSGEVLGLAAQQLFCRDEKTLSSGETRTQRLQRERESRLWPESVAAVGSAPDDRTQWVHVCDRQADVFATFDTCRQFDVDCVIRVCQNRRCAPGHHAEAAEKRLLDWTRSLRAGGEKTLPLRSRPNRKRRDARLKLAWAPMTLFEPELGAQGRHPLHAWVVRAWEPKTPKGEDPIEWVLVVTMPVENVEDAKRILHWYSLRWLIEEYHKCLKTGCRIEARQLETRDRLEACIAMSNVVSVRLLALKLAARSKARAGARPPVDDLHIQLLAAHQGIEAESLTAYTFWREVAKLGGFLGRKGDGEPGWQTLWLGWMQLDAMAFGARLAQQRIAKCG